jgi:hypothetical protein
MDAATKEKGRYARKKSLWKTGFTSSERNIAISFAATRKL